MTRLTLFTIQGHQYLQKLELFTDHLGLSIFLTIDTIPYRYGIQACVGLEHDRKKVQFLIKNKLSKIYCYSWKSNFLLYSNSGPEPSAHQSYTHCTYRDIDTQILWYKQAVSHWVEITMFTVTYCHKKVNQGVSRTLIVNMHLQYDSTLITYFCNNPVNPAHMKKPWRASNKQKSLDEMTY